MKMAGRFRIPLLAKVYGELAATGRDLCFNPARPNRGGEPTRSAVPAESNGPNSLTLW